MKPHQKTLAKTHHVQQKKLQPSQAEVILEFQTEMLNGPPKILEGAISFTEHR